MKLDIRVISAEKTWPLRHEVMWPQMPFDFIKLPEDAMGTHFGLFANQKLVSIVSLFQTAPTIAQFRKLATKSDKQGKGYATELLIHLINFAENKDFTSLWCNARADKINFYKKFGMAPTHESYIKQNKKFVILKKVL